MLNADFLYGCVSKLRRESIRYLLVGVTPILASVAYSQSDGEDEEDIFELSPFEVDGSNDHGYRAENTLSGSRMNMSLADVAQSVTVLTSKFLEDVGAESVDDLLLYSVNAESYLEEDKIGAEGQIGSEISFSPNGRRNIRGQTASVTVDYGGGGGTVDTYNTSRAEVSQGPIDGWFER